MKSLGVVLSLGVVGFRVFSVVVDFCLFFFCYFSFLSFFALVLFLGRFLFYGGFSYFRLIVFYFSRFIVKGIFFLGCFFLSLRIDFYWVIWSYMVSFELFLWLEDGFG